MLHIDINRIIMPESGGSGGDALVTQEYLENLYAALGTPIYPINKVVINDRDLTEYPDVGVPFNHNPIYLDVNSKVLTILCPQWENGINPASIECSITDKDGKDDYTDSFEFMPMVVAGGSGDEATFLLAIYAIRHRDVIFDYPDEGFPINIYIDYDCYRGVD